MFGRGTAVWLAGLGVVGVVGAALIGASCAGESIEGVGCPPAPGCPTSTICCGEATLCAQQTCGATTLTCSLATGGSYEWIAGEALCDDANPCTLQDRCREGRCAGTPDPCDDPPPSTCAGRSVVHYRSPGQCTAAGGCQYPVEEVACAQGCADGRCLGEPCKGVTCDTPPVCHDGPGVCRDGACEYPPSAAGAACQAGEGCGGGACDGQGRCQATAGECQAAHATGGTCVAGACQGFVCEPGWGNCDGDWGDGCEVKLDSNSHCGECGKACPSGPNSTASCVGGACRLSCKAPYKDCNDDPSDGCEIPVGVANRCDSAGLNAAGCGTAYCGVATNPKAVQFGSWSCAFCAHCHRWPDGWSWCLSSSSGQFSPDRCDSCCSESQADLVCSKD